MPEWSLWSVKVQYRGDELWFCCDMCNEAIAMIEVDDPLVVFANMTVQHMGREHQMVPEPNFGIEIS